MGFKIGILEIDTDYSSSETSLASSSSDEQKKMNKKAAKGKDHKYRAEKVPAYESLIGPPSYRKKGEERKKTRFLPPPTATSIKEPNATPIQLPTGIGKMDEADVRAALLKHVSSQACWRSGAAEEMTIGNLKLTNAFIYRCEMFVEVRKVKWISQGYKKGQKFDPPAAGASPMPWDMEMVPKQKWKEEKRKAEVPYTSSVRKCWYCKGKGQVRCRDCKGRPPPCSSCGGGGTVAGPEGDIPCWSCGGSGRGMCVRCHSAGKYKCKTCSGHKKLKWSVQNHTKWETHCNDKIHEETALPDKLVSEVKGQEMYQDEGQVLAPLTAFPEQCIVKFSNELLPTMFAKYSKEGRILAMRHTVLATPVTEVDWKFEDQGGKFFVYGLDRRVYFPDYPQQSCCSLL